MPETKTETKAAKATKSTKKAKAPKAEQPKREKVPAADLMTFAVRIPKSDSAAFHKAAGAGRASQVARRLLVAFANGDEGEFRAVVKEAKEPERDA